MKTNQDKYSSGFSFGSGISNFNRSPSDIKELGIITEYEIKLPDMK